MNTPPTSLVIWGSSGHARVLCEFTATLGYRLLALFDNNPGVESPFAGVPVFHGRAGFDSWRASCREPGVQGLVAIGGARGRDRREIQAMLLGAGITPATVVHPTAFVAADARLGAGTQVLAQAAIAADARLGQACIVNTAASVDHECRLADGVHIAPGARLAGCVVVGENTLVGIGAVVLPRIRLGDNCIIGAGAVVTRNVPDGTMVYGNPARVVRASLPKVDGA